MADRIKIHQVIAQARALPSYEYSETLPAEDGYRTTGWHVHGGDGEQLYTGLEAIDTDLDGIPDGWPGADGVPAFLPEYIYIDDPDEESIIDFRLAAGNGAAARTNHTLQILTQRFSGSQMDCGYFDVLLYQGDPDAGGTLIHQSENQQEDFWEGTPTYHHEEIPEGEAKWITNYEDLWVRIRIYGMEPESYPCRYAFGRVALQYPSAPVALEGPGRTSLWISDVEWQPMRDGSASSLQITKDFGNRTTLKVRLRDNTRSRFLRVGEEVFFYFLDRCVFGGTIERVRSWFDGDIQTNPLIQQIECVDWSRMLERFIVAEAWDDTSLEGILRKILEESTLLASKEGITLGTVPAFTFTRVAFKYNRANDAIRELCEKAGGLTYSIHPYTRVLSVYDRVTHNAPWTIGDAGTERYRNLSLDSTIGQYRNVQWIVGGQAETAELVEKIPGQGEPTDPDDRQRTFPLSYEVSRIVSIVRVTGGTPSDPLRLGIRGIDKDNDLEIADPEGNPAWPQWFYRRGEIQLSQNAARDNTLNPTLAPTEYLEVHYFGLMPAIGCERNEAGVSERARVDGGSGVWEAVDEDEKLDLLQLLEDRANRLLEQFGRVPRTLKYEIERAGLEIGHLQAIKLAALAVDAQFMVEAINYSFPDPELTQMRVRITTLDGESQGGWASYWRKIAAAGRKFSIREGDTVLKFVQPEEDLVFTDTVEDSVNGSVTIPALELDPYSVAGLGLITTGWGETFGLWRLGRSRIGVPYAVP